MSVLVTIGAVALVALWAMGSYNRLVGLRNQVTNGWRQIDVQLKRRHDLIPNLVNTVKRRHGVRARHARSRGDGRAQPRRRPPPGRPTPASKEGELSQALGRLLRARRELPAAHGQRERARCCRRSSPATENKVGFARQFYNDIATKYNTAQQVIPGNIIAGFAGFKPAELFEITERRRAGGAGRRSVDEEGRDGRWHSRHESLRAAGS